MNDAHLSRAHVHVAEGRTYTNDDLFAYGYCVNSSLRGRYFIVVQDFKSLSNQLVDFMSKATEDKPLVLIIDSLHLLSGRYSNRLLVR